MSFQFQATWEEKTSSIGNQLAKSFQIQSVWGYSFFLFPWKSNIFELRLDTPRTPQKLPMVSDPQHCWPVVTVLTLLFSSLSFPIASAELIFALCSQISKVQSNFWFFFYSQFTSLWFINIIGTHVGSSFSLWYLVYKFCVSSWTHSSIPCGFLALKNHTQLISWGLSLVCPPF